MTYEHVTPKDALELYLQEKSQECTESTVRSHRSRLSHFIEWFESETDYTHVHELGGLDLRKYRLWRYDDDYSPDTIKTQQDTLRVFLKFCRDIDSLPAELPEKVKRPDRGGQRDNEIPYERSREILEHLDQFEYATHQHVSLHLLWYSMMRVSSLRAIDVDDVDLDDGYIEIRHREKTRLKNAEKGERTISIRPETVSLLRDYIEQHRHDVQDDYGRNPLITTQHGRPHTTTLRNWCYAWTRPCVIGQDCPHDRDEKECEATDGNNHSCKCPSSESTHALRRGSISWHLRQETPASVVGDRADVSVSVLREHYSTLTEREKADVRASKLPE